MLLPSNICGACADCVTVVTPPRVTAPVTGLTCPLPGAFVWQGVQYTTSAFITAVQAQVPGAVYNGVLCQFTAPAGSVFPSLVVSAVAAPLPPVTASVTGLACPLPSAFLWQGTQYSTPTFITAVQAQVPGAVYNGSLCQFTAPAGSVFPPLAVSAVAAPPPPVTAPVTGLTCPLPGAFVWQGVQYTTSAFITAVQAQVPGAVYNGVLCQFTAPAGSVFPSLVVSAVAAPPPPPAANTGILSQCPITFPTVFVGVTCANIIALKQAVEAYYSVVTTYNAATCEFTRVGGLGAMPASIPVGPVAPTCLNVVTNDTVNDNASTPLFKIVTGPVGAGFSAFNDNSGAFISVISDTAQTFCGITYSVPVANNAGVVIGYGVPAAAVAPPPPPPPPQTAVLSPCPVVFPRVFNNVAYNSLATLQSAVEAFYNVTLSYASATCTFTKTGGTGTLGTVALTAAPAITPTGSAAACPLVFPVVYNAVTYTTLLGLQGAVEAANGITVSYNSVACVFNVLTGPVSPLPTVVLTAVASAQSVVLSPCPAAVPVYWSVTSATYATLALFQSAVETFYNVTTSYNATTCTFTKTGGAGNLPATLVVEPACNNTLTGATWNDNAGAPVFKIVTGTAGVGFSTLNDNAGIAVTIISNTPQTKCGITYSVPVSNNAGVVIGYGASL